MSEHETSLEQYKHFLLERAYNNSIMQDFLELTMFNLLGKNNAPVPADLESIAKKMIDRVIDILLASHPITISLEDSDFKEKSAEQTASVIKSEYTSGSPSLENLSQEFGKILQNLGEKKVTSYIVDHVVNKFLGIAGQSANLLMQNINPEILRLTREEAAAVLASEVGEGVTTVTADTPVEDVVKMIQNGPKKTIH